MKKMKTFAKIIELPKTQVVILKGSDNDDLEHIKVIFMVGDATGSLVLGFEDDSKTRDEAFENMTEEKVSEIIGQYVN